MCQRRWPGHWPIFDLGLLHAVFAEEREAQPGGGADGLRRLAFADGEERDRFRRAPGAGARGGDALPDIFEVRGDIHADI